MTHKVIITKNHCTGQYSDTKGCPLYVAIKEQYPEFPLIGVQGYGELMLENAIGYYYPHIHYNVHESLTWNAHTMGAIINGEIEQFEVTITTEPIK